MCGVDLLRQQVAGVRGKLRALPGVRGMLLLERQLLRRGGCCTGSSKATHDLGQRVYVLLLHTAIEAWGESSTIPRSRRAAAVVVVVVAEEGCDEAMRET